MRLSIFLPYLFPFSSLVACCRSLPSCETNTFPSASIHLCPILPRSLLCLSLHHSLFSSLPHLFCILTSPRLVFSMLFFSSLQAPLMYSSSISFSFFNLFLLIWLRELLLSMLWHFSPPWMLWLSHRVKFSSSVFQVFEFFFSFSLPSCEVALSSTGESSTERKNRLVPEQRQR